MGSRSVESVFDCGMAVRLEGRAYTRVSPESKAVFSIFHISVRTLKFL